jgi:hypothetical protein
MCFPQTATSDANYNPLKRAVVAAQRHLWVVQEFDENRRNT